MFDRQLLGDVVVAVLVAVPAAALARPQAIPLRPTAPLSAPATNSAVALASAGDRQVGLFR